MSAFVSDDHVAGRLVGILKASTLSWDMYVSAYVQQGGTNLSGFFDNISMFIRPNEDLSTIYLRYLNF